MNSFLSFIYSFISSSLQKLKLQVLAHFCSLNEKVGIISIENVPTINTPITSS